MLSPAEIAAVAVRALEEKKATDVPSFAAKKEREDTPGRISTRQSASMGSSRLAPL